jgi:hypothetical protein
MLGKHIPGDSSQHLAALTASQGSLLSWRPALQARACALVVVTTSAAAFELKAGKVCWAAAAAVAALPPGAAGAAAAVSRTTASAPFAMPAAASQDVMDALNTGALPSAGSLKADALLMGGPSLGPAAQGTTSISKCPGVWTHGHSSLNEVQTPPDALNADEAKDGRRLWCPTWISKQVPVSEFRTVQTAHPYQRTRAPADMTSCNHIQ